MAERKPTRKPVIVAGTNLISGNSVNTGQVLVSQGGVRHYSHNSGVVGPDVAIHVGGGRVDQAILHNNAGAAASGLCITLYDTAVVVSGGPLPASGHKIVAQLKHPGQPNVSGLLHYPVVIPLGFTFTSGLVHSTASGQPGFSLSYTPTVSGTQNIG